MILPTRWTPSAHALYEVVKDRVGGKVDKKLYKLRTRLTQLPPSMRRATRPTGKNKRYSEIKDMMNRIQDISVNNLRSWEETQTHLIANHMIFTEQCKELGSAAVK